MNRKIFSFVMLVICILAKPVIAQQKGMSPNIIIINADDLGYGDLSCYNSKSKIPTANIDQLASEGLLFTDAHAPSAICSPSRYGILTGRYSWRTDRQGGNPAPGEQPWIEEGRETIASILRDNGYNTAVIGKWGLGSEWSQAAKPGREGLDISAQAIDYSKPVYSAKSAGFTYESVHLWYGREYYEKVYPCNELPNTVEKSDGGRWYFENGMSKGGEPKFEEFDMEEAQMHYIQRTVEYIDAAGNSKPDARFNLKKDAPFFLYYAPHIPHYPHVPHQRFQGATELGLYGDFVYELDWAVGQIVEALKRNGLFENTVIVFTSDNGPEHQTYGYIKDLDHRSMADFRGVKRDLYQGGHTIPMIISFPSKLKKEGISTDRLVSQTDLLATIADYLNIILPHNSAEDSFSFLDELIPNTTVEKSRNFAIHHSGKGKLAIRSDNWVFIYSHSGDDNDVEPEWFKEGLGVKMHNLPYELFDLESDPRQTINVAEKYPEKVQELMGALFTAVYEKRTVSR